MRRAELLRSVLAGTVTALVACGCSSGPDHPEDVGVVQIALAAAPSDAACLQIDAIGVRSVSKQFTLRVGASATLQMTGLPLGDLQFTGSAFAEACGGPSSPPTWISDPVPATILKGTIAQITLVLHRNGRASISVDFSDGPPDGGLGGGSGGGGSSGSGGLGGMVATGGASGLGGSAGSSGADAGTDAGGSGGGAGHPATCIPPSPNVTWYSESVGSYPSVVLATDPDGVWILSGTGSVVRLTQTSEVPSLIASDNEYLYALWGSSYDDVWAGGTRLHHWNGTAWSDLTPPELLLDPAHQVKTLAGRTSDDVWLSAWPLGPSGSTRLFHWDGSSWTERTPPDSLTGGLAFVSDIWVSPAHIAWAAARWQANGTSFGGVLRWTGAAWELALSGNYSDGDWHSVWGSADDDVWVAGLTGMAHFDGVSWQRDNTAPQIPRISAPVLWGSCSRDVWAVGPDDRIWHFDGSGWSQVAFTSSVPHMKTVSGTGPDDVWFGGQYSGGGSGVMMHRYASLCGNGRIDPGEDCDTPYTNGCDGTCHHEVPACGNGQIDPGEDCDPPDGIGCDATCHRTCVASAASCSTGGLPCCGGLRCSGGSCQCVPTGASCSAGDACCAGTCTNGTCCEGLGSACGPSSACCSGLVCSTQGRCVQQQPTCMPDGGLCSSQSQCCSGAPCVNGLCGGACILDGAACDPAHPCCSSGSTCTSGVCGGVACMPLGQSCSGPNGLTCCSGNRCGGFGVCRNQGGSCADVGMNCNTVPNGCCSGSTCVAGRCTVVVGCYPSGQYCTWGQSCCSGTCVTDTTIGPVGHCL